MTADALAGHSARGRARTDARPGGRAGTVRVASVVRAALYVLLAGNLVRFPALASGAREAPILVNDLAVIAIVGGGLFASLAARSLPLDGTARAGLLFAAVGGASAVLAVPRFGLTTTELLFSLAYLARWLLYFALYVAVANSVRRHQVPGIVRTFETVVLVFAAFGIVQSIFLPGFAQLVYPEDASTVVWDRQGHRLVSTFLDPNFAGAFVAMGLLLAVARLSCGVRVAPLRIAVLVAALLMTASRSSILATLVGGAVIVGAVGASRRTLRVGAAIVVLAIPFSPLLLRFVQSFNKLAIDASALDRVIAWLRAVEVFADHPIIGVGFNTYGFAQRAYGYEPNAMAFSFSLDGGLIFIAVMTGVTGLACFLALLWRAARRSRRVWRSAGATRDERGLAVAAVAAMAALVVHSLFVNSLLLPFLMEPLWLLLALAAVVARALARDAAAARVEGAA